MNDEELSRWFEANKNILETAYLAGTHPWQQSGVGLRTPRSAQDWEVLRGPSGFSPQLHSSCYVVIRFG